VLRAAVGEGAISRGILGAHGGHDSPRRGPLVPNVRWLAEPGRLDPADSGRPRSEIARLCPKTVARHCRAME
jgi:hypothetical protein